MWCSELPFGVVTCTLCCIIRNIQFFGLKSQCKVTSPYVVVVGFGGVGSHATFMLLRSGIGRLLLVDFDQVLWLLFLSFFLHIFCCFIVLLFVGIWFYFMPIVCITSSFCLFCLDILGVISPLFLNLWCIWYKSMKNAYFAWCSVIGQIQISGN